MTQNITILILFHNKVEQTIECIESFIDLKCKILILNNNSDPVQVGILNSKINNLESVEMIHSDKNLGVSRGRNKLISHVETDWLFFVDNDIVLKDFRPVIKLFKNEFIINNFNIICPRIYNVHDSSFSLNINTEIYKDEIKINFGDFDFSNCFPGGASIVHKRVFNKIGNYDEEMFVGFEDYEFSIRAILMKQELRVFNSKEILLIHDHRVAISKSDSVAINARYNIELLQKSFNYFQDKFGLKLNHEWQDWSKQQSELMNKSNSLSRIKKFFKRIGF